MSTSGSYNFTANRDEIIDGALRMAAGLGDWETASATQVTKAAFLLNSIIKSYHNIGMPVWTNAKISIPLSLFVDGVITIGIGATANYPKPLKVSQVILDYYESPTELELIDKQSYNIYRNDVTVGNPNVAHYEPLRTTGILRLFPLPSPELVVGGTIDVYHQTTLQDVDTAADELDFPVEWIRLLVYELAVDLAPVYGLPTSERNLLVRERDLLKMQAMNFDVEEGSVFLMP